MAKPPQQVPARPALTTEQVEAAGYVGSGEHKDRRWWGGLPGAYVPPGGAATRLKKQRTTICPMITPEERGRATLWVRSALRAGQLRYVEGDGDYPKKIWYSHEGRSWFGLCANTAQGHYKGWPISEDERVEVFG